jgi:hypothetical protein
MIKEASPKVFGGDRPLDRYLLYSPMFCMPLDEH